LSSFFGAAGSAEDRPAELFIFDEAEPARLPRIHDVAVAEVSFIDGKGRAISRTPKIDAASGQSLHPAEEWAGKEHVAAGSGPMTFPHASGEARLNVLGTKVHEIETPYLSPKKDRPRSPGKRSQPMGGPLFVDPRTFVQDFHGRAS
jgi:hypothetical protein